MADYDPQRIEAKWRKVWAEKDAFRAVDNLFVREHRLALGAPIHAAALAIGEIALEHAQEKPLVPAVVFRFACGDFTMPVVAESESLAHALHLRDVAVGPFPRRHAALDGRIFRRQAKRVPTDGVQDVEPAHAFVTGDGVANRVIAHVTHVERAGGVRQHFEQIVFRAG